MQDESIYRCINPACARAMPRPVNFCPWCGTAQSAQARTLADERAAEADAAARRATLAAAGASAAASLSGWSDAPEMPERVKEPVAPAPAPPPASTPAPAPVPTPPPTQPPAAPPSAHAFGHGGGAGAGARDGAGSAGARSGAAPRPGVTAGQAGPRQREPIRLRWWILALAVLWGVWLVAKPSARKNERRIEAAVGLARECKAKEAQDELIALRSARATPAQLERLQKALNQEAAKCTRRQQRLDAWSDTSAAAEAALKAGNTERARTRLQGFIRRWGEDADTRALRERIDAARREHPLAVPRSSGGSGGGGSGSTAGGDAQSARNLIREARTDLARGAFNAASDKMALCLSMVDPGNRECAALRDQAEREGKLD